MPKNTPIPRIPRFHPRKAPLKAAELNLMVDAINALALSITPSQQPTRRNFSKVQYPLHCQYRYDYDTGNGYASVTSGKVIERFLTTENTAPIYHTISNTWQIPDEPFEMEISPEQHLALSFEVDVDGKIVSNTPTIQVLDEINLDTTNWRPKNPENTSGRTGSYKFSIAKLVVLPDKPNGISDEEWAAFEINAGESHFHWTGERLFDNTTNAANTGEGRVLKGYDEADNKYFFRNIISNNSNSGNAFIEVHVEELTNSIELSATISNGVTGNFLWESYTGNGPNVVYQLSFENGILIDAFEDNTSVNTFTVPVISTL